MSYFIIDKYDKLSYNELEEKNCSKGGNIMAVASLVLGICSLVFPFIGLGWLSVLLGVIGTILGALGRKNAEKKGIATAGMVMSIISVVLGVVMWIACAACVGGLATIGSSMS